MRKANTMAEPTKTDGAIPREFSHTKEAINNKLEGDGLQTKKDDDSGEALMMAMACTSPALKGQKKHSCSIIDLIQKEFGIDLVSRTPMRSCARFSGGSPAGPTPTTPQNLCVLPAVAMPFIRSARVWSRRYRCRSAAALPLGSREYRAARAARARFPPRYPSPVLGRILTNFCLPSMPTHWYLSTYPGHYGHQYGDPRGAEGQGDRGHRKVHGEGPQFQ